MGHVFLLLCMLCHFSVENWALEKEGPPPRLCRLALGQEFTFTDEQGTFRALGISPVQKPEVFSGLLWA